MLIQVAQTEVYATKSKFLWQKSPSGMTSPKNQNLGRILQGLTPLDNTKAKKAQPMVVLLKAPSRGDGRA